MQYALIQLKFFQHFMLLSKNLGNISVRELKELESKIIKVSKMLNGLIKALKNRIA